jgi:hypothetical protein
VEVFGFVGGQVVPELFVAEEVGGVAGAPGVQVQVDGCSEEPDAGAASLEGVVERLDRGLGGRGGQEVDLEAELY